jgi:8-oxo-dGTP pyrophosphatase MutT (NUDIX family)
MHPSDLGPGVTFFDVEDVRFDEVPGPELSPDLLAAVDSAWEEMVRANPTVFDGPVVLCSDLNHVPLRLEVSWSRATYRYRTVRLIPSAPALSSMFVCVLQPTSDGRLLVGRMSGSTSDPGAVQFPGGNLEPPPSGRKLDASALRRQAATELAEETGIDASPDDLVLSSGARTSNGNVGFFFLAPSLPVELILRCHAAAVVVERSRGREPEFAEVALVGDVADLDLLEGRPADYLRPLVDRFAGGLGSTQTRDFDSITEKEER